PESANCLVLTPDIRHSATEADSWNLGDRQYLLYLQLSRSRFDGDVVLRQSRRTFQPRLVRLHLLGRNTNTVGVHTSEPFHRRMPALPSHPQGALQDHLQAVQ